MTHKFYEGFIPQIAYTLAKQEINQYPGIYRCQPEALVQEIYGFYLSYTKPHISSSDKPYTLATSDMMERIYAIRAREALTRAQEAIAVAQEAENLKVI